MEIPDIYKDAILTKTSPVIMKTSTAGQTGPTSDAGQTGPTADAATGPTGTTNGPTNGLGEEVEPFPLDANGNPIKTQMLDANGKPMVDSVGNPIYVGKDGHPIYVDAAGNPISMNMVGQTTPISSAVSVNNESKEHQLILEKEKVIEDLIRQYNTQQQQQQQQMLAMGSSGSKKGESDAEGKDRNVAVDFFLKMVKTYFALVLKFGDTVANSVIRMTMPSQIADPIISDTPLNIADLVKTADRVNQVLANPEFKSELGNMFDNTSDAVNPQIKMLLNKMADIILEVAGKTGSKLASTTAVTLSAFPPFAPIFAIADFLTVGINAVTSGVNMVSTAANSGAKVLGAFNDTPSVDINKYMDKTVDKTKTVDPDKTLPPVPPADKDKPSTSPPVSPPSSPPVSPPVSPIASKKVGGGIKEVAIQLARDVGLGQQLDNASDFVHKAENVVQNVKNELKPIFNGWIEKYTSEPTQRGGKKTRRAIHRINKTIHDFHQTNKVKKTKRKK